MATAVLAVLCFFSIVAVVVYYFKFYKRAHVTDPSQPEAKLTFSPPPDSTTFQGKLRRMKECEYLYFIMQE